MRALVRACVCVGVRGGFSSATQFSVNQILFTLPDCVILLSDIQADCQI